ncbi:hypothetical protein ACIRL3_23880 [Streptomyces sp. NPDC102384]|uniref:hypothetical protein n=1 Tax=Streptomyces sp. NPDC102384 TaxID=3366166 RepID=UPI003821E6ED
MPTASRTCWPDRPPLPPREPDLRRVINALARSLSDDGISDAIYDALNEVLDTATDFAPDELQHISNTLRSAARQLIHIAPYRTVFCPAAQLARLRTLHDERPVAEHSLSYVRRFAVAISALLDEMGDDT